MRFLLLLGLSLGVGLASCRVPTARLLDQARRAEASGAHERACGLWARLLRHRDLSERTRFRAERAGARCALRQGHLAALAARARARLAHGQDRARGQDRVHAHYQLALVQAIAATGDLPRALAHLRTARQIAQREPELPYREGVLLLAGDRFAEAVAPLRRALRLRPRWAAARVALARALVETGHATGAREVLRLLPDASPSTKQVARASRLMASVARRADPVPPQARPRLDKALSLLRLEFTSAAAQVLRKATERFPNVATFSLLYGLTMVRLSNYAAAFRWLRRAAHQNPEDPSPPTHLGDLLAKTGKLQAALVEYRRACALDPVHPTAHAGLGLTLLRLHRSTEALPVLRRAAVLAGRSPEILATLSRALAATGHLDAALRMLRRAARDKDAPTATLIRFVRLLLRRYRSGTDAVAAEKDYREALAMLRRILKAQPEHVEARTLLGRLTGKAPTPKARP